MPDAAAPPPLTATSPGAHCEAISGAIALRELRMRGKINLRGGVGAVLQSAAGQTDAESAAGEFLAAATAAFGVAPPTTPNTVARADDAENDVAIFWLAHDEWLAHCPPARVAEYQSRLRERLAGVHYAATEVTDYYTVLELAGRGAEEVLARGCPLDLHGSVFAAGQCAQSRFGNASVLLYKPAADCFHIQVRWSFTEYVWNYLTRALQARGAY